MCHFSWIFVDVQNSVYILQFKNVRCEYILPILIFSKHSGHDFVIFFLFAFLLHDTDNEY